MKEVTSLKSYNFSKAKLVEYGLNYSAVDVNVQGKLVALLKYGEIID